ncbi:TetR/AcrR family transcriptional regulator [Curtobacterium sp. VKM Ac-1393]|uniref:TetR/AcrR family transcriptional regulator n=1 Tax=Curtobacterium sp. VKM Ac-1393 TaxID=2783814 RepID=UPI00188B9F36|nr:TetR/AcrR family transcriptional regulator [Curtobacterium sp. VKM Ac-1393]MBF4609468.1 TetR/AcrR family transcriptional regulator [Curtobacterium sp. VKM Ac-1393]
MPRPRKFDEEAVVESAAGVFATAGYGGTTMEELSRATGLGKQSIYNTFGGKRELFLRALERSTSTQVDRLTVELSSGTSSPLERIRAHLDALAITFTSEGPLDSLFTKATVELADRDPDVAEAARRAYGRLEAEYAGCIEQAQTAGEVDGARDTRALATYFVAVTRGMEVLGTAGADRSALLRVGRAALTLLT